MRVLTVGYGWSAGVFGIQGLCDTIHDALMTIDFIELDFKKRRSPDAHVKEHLALGPPLAQERVGYWCDQPALGSA